MFCTGCGNKVSDTAVFCTKCGKKLNYGNTENTQENLNNEEISANAKSKELEEMKLKEEERIAREKAEKEAEKSKRTDLEKALNNMQNRQKRCPYCGALVLNNSQFCKNCGKSI